MNIPVIIQCVEGGPYIIRGRHVLKGSRGEVLQEGTYVALCRCGRSKALPLCDGTHAMGDGPNGNLPSDVPPR